MIAPELCEHLCWFLRFVGWQAIVGNAGYINVRQWQKSIQRGFMEAQCQEITIESATTRLNPQTPETPSVTVKDPVSGKPLIDVRCTDVLAGLRSLPSDSVHLVFTSPPYWRVRDYGVPGQLGREETLAEHLENLVVVFREIRRVLHPSGTCWVNYGDVLAQNGSPITDYEKLANVQRVAEKNYETAQFGDRKWNRAAGTAKGAGLAEKQLCLVPERLALALQADGWQDNGTGWWLRSQIIWHKGNGNSESIKDRPSRDHEMLYLFAKRPRYFYNIFGLRNEMRVEDGWIYGTQLRTVWRIPTSPARSGHPATFPSELPRRGIMLATSELGCCPECLSPVRPIYEPGSPDLEAQRRCGGDINGEYHGQARRDYSKTLSQDPSEVKRRKLNSLRPRRLVGAQPTCRCLTRQDEAIPCTVLDPFAGEGTTGRVALDLGRFYVGIELNQRDVDYQRAELLPKARRWANLRSRNVPPVTENGQARSSCQAPNGAK